MATYTTKQNVTTGSVTYSGDTFTGIVVTPETYVAFGGALRVTGDADVTISNTTFVDNLIDADTAARYGGAIGFNSTGTLTISNSVFDNNRNIQDSYTGGAGAIHARGSGIVNISGSVFTGNSSRYGGAIHNSGVVMSVTDSYFSNNAGPKAGGAIRNQGGTLTISGLTFNGNSSNCALYNESTVNVDGLIVLQTTGDKIMNKGTMVVRTAEMGLVAGDDNIFTKVIDSAGSNFLTDNALTIDNSTDFELVTGSDYDCYVVAKNREGDYTLAAMVSDSGTTCSVRAGETLYAGYGYADYASAAGQGLPVVFADFVREHSDAPLSLASSVSQHIFAKSVLFASGNTTGVNLGQNASAKFYGSTFSKNFCSTSSGAVHLQNGATVEIYDAQFVGNTARNGGVMYIGNNGTAFVSGSILTGNRATVNGGAFHLASATAVLTIKDSLLEKSLGGGAIYSNRGSVDISGSTFSGNTAGSNGALNNAQADGTISIRDTVFATGTDTITNAGTLNMSGVNEFNASINGTGTFNVASGATLIFGNTAAINVAGLTFAGGNTVTLRNAAPVNFTAAQDLSTPTLFVNGSAYAGVETTVASGVSALGSYTVTGADPSTFLKLENGDLVMYTRTADVDDSVSEGSYTGTGTCLMTGGTFTGAFVGIRNPAANADVKNVISAARSATRSSAVRW